MEENHDIKGTRFSGDSESFLLISTFTLRLLTLLAYFYNNFRKRVKFSNPVHDKPYRGPKGPVYVSTTSESSESSKASSDTKQPSRKVPKKCEVIGDHNDVEIVQINTVVGLRSEPNVRPQSPIAKSSEIDKESLEKGNLTNMTGRPAQAGNQNEMAGNPGSVETPIPIIRSVRSPKSSNETSRSSPTPSKSSSISSKFSSKSCPRSSNSESISGKSKSSTKRLHDLTTTTETSVTGQSTELINTSILNEIEAMEVSSELEELEIVSEQISSELLKNSSRNLPNKVTDGGQGQILKNVFAIIDGAFNYLTICIK